MTDIGKGDKGAGAKAKAAAKRTNDQQVEGGVPRGPDGEPLVKVVMTASELIPTGQYANVSVGPAQIEAWINPNSDEPFSDTQKETIARALNELADVVERDVIAVQRGLVLEALQNGN
jgi:hypothetical protein